MENLKQNPRSMFILLGVGMLKTSILAAYKIAENVKEGDLNTEDFKPLATKDDFEDVLIFCMFIFSLLGKWKYTEYRDFISDAMNISFTYILDNVISIDSVRKFESKRDKHFQIYYSEINKFQEVNGQVLKEQIINHLIKIFEVKTAKKTYKDLKGKTLLHLSLNTALNKDFQDSADKIIGRNIQRNLTPEDIKNHFDEMAQIEKLVPKSNMTKTIYDIIFFVEKYYLNND